MTTSHPSGPLPNQSNPPESHSHPAPPTEAASATVASPAPGNLTPAPSKHRHTRKLALIGAMGAAGIATTFGYHWWQFAGTHQETDDAYVTADIHPVNARVAGTVTVVAVQDNQSVAAGDVLVKLDPSDYTVALQQAQAALDVAKQQVSVAQASIGVSSTNAQGQTTQAQGNIDAAQASISTAQAALSEAQAGVPAAQAQLAQVQANLAKAKLDYERYQSLASQGAVAQSQYDAAKASYDALVAQQAATQEQVRQAEARVTQAQENLNNAEAKLASTRGTLQQANATGQQTEVSRRQYQAAVAAVAQAETQVKNAQLQLSYTTVAAPSQGKVGNRTVQVGQRVQPGQTLMSVVEDHPWVVANFKETQLENLQPGQEVELKIDAFPNHTFTGRIDSLSPASGSRFALLPPDNATGNFTKIVQRVPIKIVFDVNSLQGYEARITPGMSVVATVETGR
jgi:membrane fusion protein, multidrug efflux system